MELTATPLIALKVIVATSIFFVWVNHYQRIVGEFREYKLPDWLRNITGILKMSFALILIISGENFALQTFSALGIVILMVCAQIVHFINKTSFQRRVPSIILLIMALIIAYASSSRSIA